MTGIAIALAAALCVNSLALVAMLALSLHRGKATRIAQSIIEAYGNGMNAATMQYAGDRTVLNTPLEPTIPPEQPGPEAESADEKDELIGTY